MIFIFTEIVKEWLGENVCPSFFVLKLLKWYRRDVLISRIKMKKKYWKLLRKQLWSLPNPSQRITITKVSRAYFSLQLSPRCGSLSPTHCPFTHYSLFFASLTTCIVVPLHYTSIINILFVLILIGTPVTVETYNDWWNSFKEEKIKEVINCK